MTDTMAHTQPASPASPASPAPTITAPGGRFVFGGDWNPEQWDESTWADDIAKLERAGINEATINVFSWALIQPDESRYDFAMLDRIVDLLVAHDFGFVLATSTGALPAWIAQRYPDTTRTDYEGRRHRFGVRHNACPNSPNFLRLAGALAGKLAERYGANDHLIAWHISNELGGRCYCDNCAAAFRVWLERKYGSIEALNRAWNANFWSHTYADFAQILPPNAISDGLDGERATLSACSIDYKRFQSDSLLGTYVTERDAIRAFDAMHPITTNLMDTYEGADYFRWGREMDVISWDDYPFPHTTPSDNAFKHDLMRGVGDGRPFMLMESTPNQTNWQECNVLRAPGRMRAESYQAVAHGADTVQYFQLKQSRGGFEKYHGAVISHGGREDERVYGEVRALGGELAAHGARFVGGLTEAPVALMFDWDSYWSTENISLLPKGFDYPDQVRRWYAPFHHRNIEVDVVPEDIDARRLAGYRVLVAPALMMAKPGVRELVEGFVRAGGTFLATVMAGMHDEHDNVILGGYPGAFREVCGMRMEEMDMIPDGRDVRVVFGSGEGEGEDADGSRVSLVAGLIKLDGGARPLAAYAGDVFYRGTPAVTVNDFGAGTAYFAGAVLDEAGMDAVVGDVVRRAGVTGIVSPEPVEVVTRRYPSRGESLTFVINHADTATAWQDTPFAGCESVLDGTVLGRDLVLEPYGVTVVRTAA